MSYWKENLLAGESVLLEGNLHWGGYIPSAVTALLGCTLGGWFASSVGLYVFGVFMLVSCYFFVPAWLRARFTEVLVTNQRVMVKTGILRRQVVEINLAHLESFEVDQSVTGRLLDYGDIRAIGTGGTIAEIYFVVSPRSIRKIALEAHLMLAGEQK
ncbi:MAG: PH domain-containing protein [Agitococcus sp.]|nr:PH domain-containing protein [Agitococcus sp.]